MSKAQHAVAYLSLLLSNRRSREMIERNLREHPSEARALYGTLCELAQPSPELARILAAVESARGREFAGIPDIAPDRSAESLDLAIAAIETATRQLSGEQPRSKRSVSIDADVEAAALELAGERGFSSYVNEALQRENQRQRVLARVARYEAEHGPIPDDVQAKADKAVRTWLASSISE